MSRFQADFNAMFGNQLYGPRNGIEARDWQTECLDVYRSLVASHAAALSENGHVAHRHKFTIYAGTGSGKTNATGLLASWMLNDRNAEQVVIVCPNKTVMWQAKRAFLKNFNIDLAVFSSQKHKDGVPVKYQGYVTTYAGLMRNRTLHRNSCTYRKTLVVFDEIHHLGDHPEQQWGESAVEAFGLAPYVIALTGTPFRSDNNLIPREFVTYEDAKRGGLFRFKADPESGTGFTYSIGRAVEDGVCRKPQFFACNGTVELRNPADGSVKTVSFSEEVDLKTQGDRLRGAVCPNSYTRTNFLKKALDHCREDGRKVAIFVGGDTQSDESATMDVNTLLPQELNKMGIGPDEYETVTSDDRKTKIGGGHDLADQKIAGFGKSDKWIIATINMLSEGADIPEVSAIILLTSITAKQTTIQRIGRGLRLRGPHDPHKTCLIFMFSDPGLVEIMREIETEIDIEQKLRKTKGAHEAATAGGGHPNRTEAVGVAGGDIEKVIFGDGEWTAEEFFATKTWLKQRKLPSSLLDAALHLHRRETEGGFCVDRTGI